MTRSIHAIIPAVLLLALPGVASAQGTSFTVTGVPPEHGKVALKPALPADGKYPAGTVVTVAATPDPVFAID
jgi:acetyl esterase